jgi:hypothetical protein
MRPLSRSEYSKQLNEMRLKVLAAREAAIQEIVHEAKLKLRDVSKNPQAYKKLLTDLLVQVRSTRPASAPAQLHGTWPQQYVVQQAAAQIWCCGGAHFLVPCFWVMSGGWGCDAWGGLGADGLVVVGSGYG